MEICDFAYHRPASVTEALELGRSLGPDGRYLAGGTDVLVDLKTRRFATAHLIALLQLPELRQIRPDGDRLRVGAMATMTELATSPVVRELAPALGEAALSMGCLQIRNRATVGGNFCAAVPCADAPPICLASGARLRIVGPKGERELSSEEFFLGPRRTALEPGELLSEIVLPAAPRRSGASYQRFARRRHASLAVAGVAAFVRLEGEKVSEARVALTAVAPTIFVARAAGELLAGQKPTEVALAAAASAAAEAARPIADLRSSDAFRRDLVETLARRALEQAVARARA